MNFSELKHISKTIILLIIFSCISLNTFAKTKTLPNSYFQLKELTSNYVSWGIDPKNSSSINLKDAWLKYKKEKDVVVAIIDTGIDPMHPFLEKNIFVEEGKINYEKNFGIDFALDKKNPNTPLDQHGHGTHVAGIIKSIYPEVKILALKYYNPQASGLDNLNSSVKALQYAVAHNVDIINYSGGGPESSKEELAALKEANNKGILIIVAAGNEESNIDLPKKEYYPASYELSNMISVTAYDEDLKILSSSNYGAYGVDIFAPGYRIKSSLQNGRTGYLTGTSQATAFVTGVAALIKSQYPKLSAIQIKNIIKKSAKKEATMTDKCSAGGRIDASLAMEQAKNIYMEMESSREIANKAELTIVPKAN